jgi:hypothetical protein
LEISRLFDACVNMRLLAQDIKTQSRPLRMVGGQSIDLLCSIFVMMMMLLSGLSQDPLVIVVVHGRVVYKTSKHLIILVDSG